MIICIEGGDGAGKATQTQLLKDWLESQGKTVATLSFPRYGKTLGGKAVSSYLKGDFGTLEETDPYAASLLYVADRLESRNYVKVLAEGHDYLILDRYVFSNMAYQAAKLPSSWRSDFISWCDTLEFVLNKMPVPDLVLYLDVDTSVSSGLMSNRSSLDIHETADEYLNKVRRTYRLMLERQVRSPWIRIRCLSFRDSQILPKAVIASFIQQAVMQTEREI